MAEENFADQCATGTEDFSSGFIQNTAQMEQQPLQQPIEQQAGGDGQNQTAQSIISMARPEDDGRKIFVGGLSWDTTTKELKDYFGQFGKVEEALIKQDPVTGRSRGFGFVLFENEHAIKPATDPNSKHTLLGKHIDPKPAKSKDKKDPITKIFVGGLDPELTQDQIKEFFEKYGKVEQIDLPHDKTTNKRRAFAFVSFESETAVEAVTATPKINIHGKEVDVKKATPHHQQAAFRTRGSARGRGMGRGRGYGMNNWNEWNQGGNYPYDYSQTGYGWYDYSQGSYGGSTGGYANDYSSYGYGNQGWGGYGSNYGGGAGGGNAPGYDQTGGGASAANYNGGEADHYQAAPTAPTKNGGSGTRPTYHPYSRP